MVDKTFRVNDYTNMLNDNEVAPSLWTVTFNFRQTLDGELPEKLSEALEDISVSVFLHNKEATDGDNWSITLTTTDKPDAEEIFRRVGRVAEARRLPGLLEKKDIIIRKTPNKDWLKHVYDSFPPLKLGKFFVHDSYYKGELPEGFAPLKIDAATAFGSGEHETTKGCILALQGLAENNFKNGLDMGCGSGILAIVLAKLWPGIKVTAVDIDPEAISVTLRHAEMNGVVDVIQTEAGDGYHTALARKNGPYDIIAANILANPLIEMAPDLARALKPGGYAVLSGLLQRQGQEVISAHEKQSLRLVRECPVGEWQTLVFQR